MKKISRLSPLVISLFAASVLSAQGILERDQVPLKNWDAPMYWQPSVAESQDAVAKQLLAGNTGGDRASSITAQAQTPVNSLVFVGMTPCRVVDTRGGAGTFGGPALIGGTFRTFPIPSSATCSIPVIAQAYSFNITIVPPGFLDFITVWPTGQARPLASTLNGYVNTVIANAAIVPAGTSGSVDVYASQNTHLIIDINGYYAAQSGITLTQGTAGAPSLSFAGDAGTGIYSTGAGTLNIATGGTTRLSVASNGDLSVAGNLNASRSDTVATEFVLENTTSSAPRTYLTKYGSVGVGDYWSGLNTANTSSLWDPNLFVLRSNGGLAFSGSSTAEHMRINPAGNVGIGTTVPIAKLEVQGNVSGGGIGVLVDSYGGSNAVVGESRGTGAGVYGISTGGGTGVYATSASGDGMIGSSISGNGVTGSSNSGHAGLFYGLVAVVGNLDVAFYTSGGTDVVCRNGARFALCSSSLRYKTAVQPFSSGLELLNRLRPISFTWKSNGIADFGLGAEDVAAIEPRLVTHNDKGDVEGVKYDHLNVVLINAVKEQQAQIEGQQKRITEQEEQLTQQQRQLDSLKELICLDRPLAAVCK